MGSRSTPAAACSRTLAILVALALSAAHPDSSAAESARSPEEILASVVPRSDQTLTEYRNALEATGDVFYTWQYDLRWAAMTLRKQGIMKPADDSPRGVWELN